MEKPSFVSVTILTSGNSSATLQRPFCRRTDSEGSLGGLIDLGTPERLGGLLQDALRDLTRCSSDPLCASHEPKRHRSMNGAACHACVLVPETSCEAFNSWLDRSLLVPTVATQDVSFFTPRHLGWE